MASGFIPTATLGNYDPGAMDGPIPPGFIKLYHYTDYKGSRGILQTQTIRQSTASTDTDALFGEGTYLTDKSPARHSKIDIAKDIWVNRDKFHSRMVKEGRTDFVLVVIIKERLVQVKVKYLLFCLIFRCN